MDANCEHYVKYFQKNRELEVSATSVLLQSVLQRNLLSSLQNFEKS